MLPRCNTICNVRMVQPALLSIVNDCWQIWGEEALQFQEKLLNSSGLGDETYFPDSEPF